MLSCFSSYCYCSSALMTSIAWLGRNTLSSFSARTTMPSSSMVLPFTSTRFLANGSLAAASPLATTNTGLVASVLSMVVVKPAAWKAAEASTKRRLLISGKVKPNSRRDIFANIDIFPQTADPFGAIREQVGVAAGVPVGGPAEPGTFGQHGCREFSAEPYPGAVSGSRRFRRHSDR